MTSFMSVIVLFGVVPITALDNGVGLTPALAWSSWNRFLEGVNESLIMEIADAIVATGLRDAGYTYINVDAGVWEHDRDVNGNLQANPVKFPSGMRALADYIHGLGLKLGLYTDIATGSCGTGPGSAGYYATDANFFANNITVDYVKVDNCGSGIPYGAPELAAWGSFSQAFNATGRQVYFSICPKSNLTKLPGPLMPFSGECCDYVPPSDWSRDDKRSVANSWLVEVRNNVDGWGPSTSQCNEVGGPCGMITNIDSITQLGKLEETGPGGLVDADMLEVCQFNGTVNHPGLSENESRLHFYVWAILPSPLILSFDPRTLPSIPGGQECLDMVMNSEVLAINQDVAVVGATLIDQTSTNSPFPANSSDQVASQVFGRPLGSVTGCTTWAALLVNRALVPQNLSITWASLGMPSPSQGAGVRDVGVRKDLGTFVGGYSVIVPPHDAVFLKVTLLNRIDPTEHLATV